MSLCDRIIRRATGSFPSLPFGHQNAAQPTNCGGNAADGRQQPAELVDMAWRGRGQGGRPEERAHREKTHGKARLGKAGARGGRGMIGGAVFVAAIGNARSQGAQLACRRHRGHDHGPPVRHEREHHRRFVHHQRRLARVARTAALNRFAARPASQRRRRRKKGRWFGATRMQKAVERRNARPPKKGFFQGARHSPSTISPLISRNQEERTSVRSTPTSQNRHATRGRLTSPRRAARRHRPSRQLQPKPSRPHGRLRSRRQPRPFPRSRASSP